MKTLRPLQLGLVVLALLGMGFVSGCTAPPPPTPQVNPALHPNLAAAQDLIQRAIDRLTMAQQANDFDMNGHAAKAKSLLDEAYSEIKLAALSANAHR